MQLEEGCRGIAARAAISRGGGRSATPRSRLTTHWAVRTPQP